MKGITLTQEIKVEFENRISFLKKRLNELEQQYEKAKMNNNVAWTTERLKEINPDWKIEKLCHINELNLREEIMRNSIFIDQTDECNTYT